MLNQTLTVDAMSNISAVSNSVNSNNNLSAIFNTNYSIANWTNAPGTQAHNTASNFNIASVSGNGANSAWSYISGTNKVNSYIIKKLINNNREYNTLFISSCDGTKIRNIGYIANILQMNTLVSNGLVFLGINNGSIEPLGTIIAATADAEILQADKDSMAGKINGQTYTNIMLRNKGFSKGLSGFIEYKESK